MLLITTEFKVLIPAVISNEAWPDINSLQLAKVYNNRIPLALVTKAESIAKIPTGDDR